MQNSLNKILERIRVEAKTEREKGEYFEKLVKIFIENDPLQRQYFDKVWRFKDWAKERDLPANDTGIDLVARHSDHSDKSGFCAIQCKFYAGDKSINKKYLDSFIAAASNKDFVSLIIIDTTLKNFSKNLENTLNNLDKDWHRITLSDLAAGSIDWDVYLRDNLVKQGEPKTLRPDQQDALKDVCLGLQKADRGKLVMACGTGKTFTSLKIAEKLGSGGKLILYMVPSLSLMSQTVREWKNDCAEDFLAFSVCSDTKVGKRSGEDDIFQFTIHDLAFPATTKANRIAEQVKRVKQSAPKKMVVIFSTYQSIQVLTKAQEDYSLANFDLIICDEAHRTTGATLAGEDESNFVRIHSNDHVAGSKRLYMTATPKIFGENAKTKAEQHKVILADMNDASTFGELLHYKGFSWAVENNLLSDYKVIVLAVDEGLVSSAIQNRLSQSSEMTLDDATKMIGCYKALTKSELISKDAENSHPMRRALAFCNRIASSKMVAQEFAELVEEYRAAPDMGASSSLRVEARHVDGTFNAKRREECLEWLKEVSDDDICRILSNARCLSEGVDVPALDGIIFMHPRKSQIDVIQSIGRVMRKAAGKAMGYVILPVAFPAGVEPNIALKDNERYKVIWQILNALRAHDERFDSTINRISLDEDVSDKIQIIGLHKELEATTEVIDDIVINKSKPKPKIGIGSGAGDTSDGSMVIEGSAGEQGAFVFDEFTKGIRAKIVEKCGTREYWETWATDIAKIATAHITRISTIVAKEGSERTAFLAFLDEIRDDLNPEISESDAIEMLAQHLITKPVFDTLFKDSAFTKNNPVSRAMQSVLSKLHPHKIANEAKTLEGFYSSIKRRAAGIETAKGRQKLIVELYEKFFRTAFPTVAERLGIVYTPVEVVDFIIHSVNDLLQSEFEQTLGSKRVHILDPFTGTGTFITRLLQSGLIKPKELEHKYCHGIHANEMVLLAYYIAAINIESTYHDLAKEHAVGGNGSDGGNGGAGGAGGVVGSGGKVEYTPFDGIVLTDTFHLYEQEKDMIDDLMPDNSERRTAQKARDIRVIIGNPPYSGGQKSQNDDAQNTSYPNLDARIETTYAAASKATLKKDLYDSYVRAIRWASDRIIDKGDDRGIVAFITGSAWIERSFADGMRKCLIDEFSNLYIFHLRGDIRKNMLSKGAAKEGGNVFGSSSMTGTAISVLVRNPDSPEQGKIHFCDIGDDLKEIEKLAIIQNFKSIEGIGIKKGWQIITPDANNDWLDQRDKGFIKYIPLGDKKDKKTPQIFENYSLGVATNRDPWCHNASKAILKKNIAAMIATYNAQVAARAANHDSFSKILDPKKISWSSLLETRLAKGKPLTFADGQLMPAHYRPFTRQWIYYSRHLNDRVGQMPQIFPNPDLSNRVIVVNGIGSRNGLTALIVDRLPDLNMLEAGAQCFPLKLYALKSANKELFADKQATYSEQDGISDDGLKHFQTAYPNQKISKQDLFYYIYGILHSPEYREKFKNNLAKTLPRIPAVKKIADFWAFSKAGQKLGELHLNYENAEPYPVTINEGKLNPANTADKTAFYSVKDMKYGGKGKDKDKTILIYNPQITLTNIPLKAYEYVVNGKPALDWIVERQSIKIDKKSGIVNDANDYANETMNNPAYPMELFQRMITVSLETMKIVNALPKLEID